MPRSPEEIARLLAELNRTGVAVLLYPAVSVAEVKGMERILSAHPEFDLYFAAASLEPVLTDAGTTIQPTVTFKDIPEIDVFVVPGGPEASWGGQDSAILACLADQAKRGVSGASIGPAASLLGQAGLLDGKRVAALAEGDQWPGGEFAPWAAELRGFGAIPADLPGVHHTDIITAAGPDAASALALELVGSFYGDADVRDLERLLGRRRPAFPRRSGSPSPVTDLGKTAELARGPEPSVDPAVRPYDAVADLRELVEHLSMVSDNCNVFYHRPSGQAEDVFSFDGFGDDEPEDDIWCRIEEEPDSWVEFPDTSEIHEFAIMEDFANSLAPGHRQAALFKALTGRRPFRHFKDAVDYENLRSDWFAYRDDAFGRIMRKWCYHHDIPYSGWLSAGRGRELG